MTGQLLPAFGPRGEGPWRFELPWAVMFGEPSRSLYQENLRWRPMSVLSGVVVPDPRLAERRLPGRRAYRGAPEPRRCCAMT